MILSRLSAFFKVEFLPLISVSCRWCKVIFCVCRCCWRGQAYCSSQCRKAARGASHRQAQRRYRQSAKGRRAHCLSENRRRHRKNQSAFKNMDDQPSTQGASGYMSVFKNAKDVSFLPDQHGYCHFCGRRGIIVSEFVRRRYGKGSYEAYFP